MQKKTNLLKASSNVNINTYEELTYDVKAWQVGYETCRSEACEELEGAIPDLEGTYFRNGHGKFEVGNEPVLHPFDGDG